MHPHRDHVTLTSLYGLMSLLNISYQYYISSMWLHVI